MLLLGEINEGLRKIENKFTYVNVETAGTKRRRNDHEKKKGVFMKSNYKYKLNNLLIQIIPNLGRSKLCGLLLKSFQVW